jgi:hypothetical protein
MIPDATSPRLHACVFWYAAVLVLAAGDAAAAVAAGEGEPLPAVRVVT